MKVLITGGAGYIGSVTARALEDAGHVPVVLDSLASGPIEFVRDRAFYQGDVGDLELLARVFEVHPDIAMTIHMAARIVVPESVAAPRLYYEENVGKSLRLLGFLADAGRPDVVFSSSASVYAPTPSFEVDELSPTAPGSPYARTKLMVEQILGDLARSGASRSLILRYFNPIGSDPSLESGVYLREPSHVLGQMTATALGRRPSFTLTGTDLPTRDGTGLRDFVHVWDVARAHVAAVEHFERALSVEGSHSSVINVGTGTGVTVRELLGMFETCVGRPLPVVEADPRPGDTVGAFANVQKANRLLGWSAELSVPAGLASALEWMRHRERVLPWLAD